MFTNAHFCRIFATESSDGCRLHFRWMGKKKKAGKSQNGPVGTENRNFFTCAQIFITTHIILYYLKNMDIFSHSKRTHILSAVTTEQNSALFSLGGINRTGARFAFFSALASVCVHCAFRGFWSTVTRTLSSPGMTTQSANRLRITRSVIPSSGDKNIF